ncbi:MAG TPA: hypothetical protein VH500_06710 [Nitrososphaeraceae archaeon]
MEVKFAGFGLSLTVDEIKQIISSISKDIYKDKKHLCLLLSIANDTILGWYSAIIEMFSPQLAIRIGAEKRQLTNEELSDLVRFIQRRDLEALVTNIINLLRQAENHYHDKGEESLADSLSTIGEILNYFSFKALGSRQEWLFRALKEQAWNIDPQDIFNWEMLLDEQRKKIAESIGSVEIKLGCGKEMIGQLLTQLRQNQ